MKKLILAIAIFLGASPLWAETMTYQGRLKESDIPVSANRVMFFQFCNAETGGSCSDTLSGAQSFAVQNGLFKATFTVPTADLSQGQWFLQVSVGPDVPGLQVLTPRERLTAVPYSVFASSAGYAAGGVQKTGDTMTGQLTLDGSTLTVTGSEFSVGGSALAVKAGNVGIGSATPAYRLAVSSGAGEAGTIMAVSTGTSDLFWVAGDGAHAARFHGDGSGLTGVTGATDNTKVLKAGDTMTGPLRILSDDLANDTSDFITTGLVISTGGAIRTTGLGHGTVAGNARGLGAVDLQTVRATGDQVAVGDYSTVSGGIYNKANEYGTSVGGGYQNLANTYYATVGGGFSNTAQGHTSVVSGGDNNLASGQKSSVSGGANNKASGDYSSMAGGESNLASGTHAAAGGGKMNRATGLYSVVPGGYNNTAEGNYSFSAGAMSSSTAQGAFTWQDSGGITINLVNAVTDRTVFKNRGGFLVTGSTNTSMSGALDRGVIMTGNGLLGVATNAPQAALDVVSTGTAAEVYAQIWRGSDGVSRASVTATGVFYGDGSGLTGVTGATDNTKVLKAGDTMTGPLRILSDDLANDTSDFITTGLVISTGGAIRTTGLGHGTVAGNARGNGAVDLQTFRALATQVASGNYSVLSGGFLNKAVGGYSVVGGGYTNSAEATYATVGGGIGNAASGQQSVVAGGNNNTASAQYAAVGGGYNNTATLNSAVVAGGSGNDATGTAASITGGANNVASGNWSAVGGGGYNLASGNSAVVPGGAYSVALGDYSLAAGRVSSSTASGAFTWADSEGVMVENAVADRTVFKNRGGFLVTGSTGTSITGTLDRAVFITGNGLVGVSTGAPQAALDVVSTGTLSTQFAQIWRDANGTIVASMTAAGAFTALQPLDGDDLGDHNADQDLQLNWNNIYTVSTITAAGNITAARYQVNGSTVLAMLPGLSTLAVGPEAGRLNAGAYNVFVGSAAGRGNPAGDNNTMVGFMAGYSNDSSGNTFIGSTAGSANLNGSQNIVIGYNQQTSNSGASSELNIGGLIFGLIGEKAVGISTRVPQAALDIVSTGTLSGQLAQIWRDSDGLIVGSMSATGSMQAVRFVGDGSGLTGVTAAGAVQKAGDTMTGALNMNGNFLAGVSTITMQSGSIAIVPPGTGGTNHTYGISIGSNVYSNYDKGVGVGYGAYGNRSDGVGMGYGARSNEFGGVGIGSGARSNSSSGVGAGYNAYGNSNYGLGVGANASDNYNHGVGLGAYAAANNDYAVGVGAYSQNNAGYGAALGAYSYASSSATALGAYAKANAEFSLALGYGTVNNSTGTASFGNYAVHTSTAVNAAYYQVAGSTALALPGSDNTFVGRNAGRGSGSPGSSNTFVGSSAGSQTSGQYNTFVGDFAGNSNTSGANNTFMGSNAALNNTTGNQNTVVGRYAAYNNKTGSHNAILGDSAGMGASNNSFSSSTLVGYQAGYSLNSSVGNILIGYKAGYSITTGTGNIVIGYEEDVYDPADNNVLNIGGVLFGELQDRTIGINSFLPPAPVKPMAALDLVSTGTASNVYAQIWRNSVGTIVSSMSATGVMKATKFIGDGSGLTGLSGLQTTGDTMTGALTIAGSSLTIRPAVSDAYSLYISSADGVTPALTVRPGGQLYAAGRVGIGMPDPGEALDISDRVQISTRSGGNDVTDGLISKGTGGMEFFSGGAKYLKVANGGNFIGIGPNANVDSTTNSPRLQVRGSMSVGAGYGGSKPLADSLVVQARLGVGTPTPDAALHVVQSDVAASSYTVHIGTSASAYHVVVTTNGWVGLNTRQPQAPLHLTAATKEEGIIVEHNSSTSEGSYLGLLKARGSATSQTLVADGDNLGVLAFGGYNAAPGDPFPTAAAIIGRVDGEAALSPDTDMPGRLEFMTAADNTTEMMTRMVIKNDGAVGISTGIPQAMLDIRSTATVAQVWRDSAGVIRASMTASGLLYANIGGLADKVSKTGDFMTGPLSITVADTDVDAFDLTTTGITISTSGALQTQGFGDGTASPGTRGVGAVDLQTSRTNTAQVAGGDFSVVAGGSGNAVPSGVDYAAVSGGEGNSASGNYSVVSGGKNNYASNYYSVVGGGYGNTATSVTDNAAAVLSGNSNAARAGRSVIAGGSFNLITATSSYIGGGGYNVAHGTYAVIAGGESNTAPGMYSAVAGGQKNTANGLHSFAGGGYMNAANGEKSVLGGGTFNTTDAQYSAIGGGYENKMQSGATAGFIGAGRENAVTASGLYAAIVGGSSNTVSGEHSFVGGGGPTLAGKPGNRVYADFSSIVGGSSNTVRAGAYTAFIGGGYGNQVTGESGSVVGGDTNLSAAFYSAVVGGNYNQATADYAFVGGGGSNIASGQYSAVPGGQSNTAKGNHSFAAGHMSSSTAAGTFTWADSQGIVTENAVPDQVRFKARGGFVVSGSTNIADPKFTVTGAGDALLDNDRTLAWGYMPAPYITGNDGSDLMAFGLTGGEKMKLQNSQLTLYNANLVLSTTSADSGIVFQDGSVQKSAAPQVVSIYKPGNEIRTLDATATPDSHLRFFVGPNEKWAFEFNLYVYTTDTTGTADMRVGLAGPPATQLRAQYDLYAENGMTVNSGGMAGAYGEYVVNWTGAVPGVGTRAVVKGTIENSVNGGIMSITWGQGVSSAVNTTVLNGSYLIAHKLN